MSNRSEMIREAAAMPKGDPKRRALLVSLRDKTASPTRAVEQALVQLKKDVETGKAVDDRMRDKYTDGELLAMLLRPVLQGLAMSMMDAEGFRKNLKKGL